MNPQSPSSSSSSEAERDAFEAWAKKYRMFLDRKPHGPYAQVFTQEAWVGWQARAARATPPSLPIDFKQASELLAMFGGEAGMVTLSIAEGHSGRGLYAHSSAYPEEGAEFLGVADEEAVPGKQASEQGGWLPLPEGRPTDDMVKAGMKRMFDEKRYSAPWDDVIALMFMDMVKAAPKSPSPHPEEGALLLGGDEVGKAMGGAAQ